MQTIDLWRFVGALLLFSTLDLLVALATSSQLEHTNNLILACWVTIIYAIREKK